MYHPCSKHRAEDIDRILGEISCGTYWANERNTWDQNTRSVIDLEDNWNVFLLKHSRSSSVKKFCMLFVGFCVQIFSLFCPTCTEITRNATQSCV